MSIDAFVSVTRAGVAVSGSPIVIQSDLMNQQDAKAYGGAEAGEGPFFRYNQYTEFPIVLAQGDLLTDQNTIDPKTGTYMKWRIIGDPEVFPDGHTEFVSDRVIGT